MNSFVCYEKLSKKEKRKVDRKKRRLWEGFGCVSPVTRTVPDKKKEHSRRLCREKVY